MASRGPESWCSQDAYLDKLLREEDLRGFSAAGFLPYKNGPAGLELLMAKERPWNSFINDYDPLAWQVLGGRRQNPHSECLPHITGGRVFLDAMEGMHGLPRLSELTLLAQKGFAIWFPRGKYAMIVFEAGGLPEDICDLFQTWRVGNPVEPFPEGPRWQTKWKKQIEALEWVPANALLDAHQAYAGDQANSTISDLLNNLLNNLEFQKFLQGSLDLSTFEGDGDITINAEAVDAYHSNPDANKGAGQKGKGGKNWNRGSEQRGKGSRQDQGKQGTKGYGKQSNWGGGGGGKNGSKAKGKGFGGGGGFQGGRGMQQPPGPAAFMSNGGQWNGQAAPQGGQEFSEMQRQLIGEQIYCLVQPMAPTAFIAQKITGMLLELPQSEFMPLVQNHEELRERVMEALAVLRSSGVME